MAQNGSNIEYIVIKAIEDGVNVLSILNTDGAPIVNERLDQGEIFLLVLNDDYIGIRIRGKAEVKTVRGDVKGESKIIFHNP